MSLSQLIEPEIKNDAFYHAIIKTIIHFPISTILEIGASSGEGSTEAFVKGILASKKNCQLYSVEVSKERYSALKNRYAYPWFFPYNVSSVPVDKFLNFEQVSEFYRRYRTGLNQYSLEDVQSWLLQDSDYILKQSIPQEGIQIIKRHSGISEFDCVLIDGSAFSGESELKQIYGAKVIILDDIHDIKNYANWQALKKDSNYQLIRENKRLRNGFAIFIRHDIPKPSVWSSIKKRFSHYFA